MYFEFDFSQSGYTFFSEFVAAFFSPSKTARIESSFIIAITASFILGFLKAGFKGLDFVIVTLMALAYESKTSTGILLPLLIVGDIFAIAFYRKDANWKILFRLFPAMAVGVVLGVLVGNKLSAELFRQVMAAIILLSGTMMVLMGKIPKDRIPDGKIFAIVMGLGAGFCTMVGNLAGAFSNIYFLAMQLPKRAFIGTAAWLFFFINLFKLPFHLWVWETVNTNTLTQNLYLAPFVIVGFLVGIKLIGFVSNAFFQKYIIGMTLLGALLILLQ